MNNYIDKLLIDNSILITDQDTKNIIISDNNRKMINHKILTDQEFYDSFFINKQTTFYLIKQHLLPKLKLEYNYELVNRIYNVLLFYKFCSENNDYSDFLSEHNIIKIPKIYKTKKLYSFNINKEYLNLDLEINEIMIDTENKVEIIYNSYDEEFKEISGIAFEIDKLLNSGISYENIKIYTHYESKLINSIFTNFNLTFNLNNSFYLKRFKSFSDILSSNKFESISEIYNLVKEDDFLQTYLKEVVNVLNSYIYLEHQHGFNSISDLLIDELNELKINKQITTRNISSISDTFLISQDTHVFIMGLNKNKLPKVKLNKNPLNELMYQQTMLQRDEQLTKRNRENLKKLCNMDNVYISFVENDNEEIESFDFNVVVKKCDNLTNNYNVNKIIYQKQKATLEKFGFKLNNYELLKDQFGVKENNISKFDIDYQFKEDMKLSATSLNSFYECSYKFYLLKILKLRQDSDMYKAEVGTYIHYILEKYFKDSFSFEDIEEDYFENNKVSDKLKFFKNEIRQYTSEIVSMIEKQHKYSDFYPTDFEQKFTFKVGDQFEFRGVIDKVLNYKNNYIVVDYKTGNSSIDSSLFKFGFDLQNIIYLYALNKQMENFTFAGTYRQKVKPKKYSVDIKEKTLFKDKSKDYFLNGLTINNLDTINLINRDLEQIQFIKGVALKKDGQLKKSNNIINSSDVDEYINSVEESIEKMTNDIKNFDFEITEKKYKSKIDSCKYCEFDSICFKKNKNKINLELEEKNGN